MALRKGRVVVLRNTVVKEIFQFFGGHWKTGFQNMENTALLSDRGCG